MFEADVKNDIKQDILIFVGSHDCFPVVKYTAFIALIVSYSSFAQIWSEPFDTLDYLDKLERLTPEKKGIKSYTITQLISKDSIVSYDYFGFDENGYLTEQFYSMHPDQKVDTNKFYYDNGICQEGVYNGLERKFQKREHFFNDKNRLIEIRNSIGDSSWSVRYTYENNLLTEISYSLLNRTIFQYDSTGAINKKEIYTNDRLKQYFIYQHPDSTTLIYQNCRISENDTPYLPCEVTEGYYDKRNRLIKIVTKYVSDSSNVFIVNAKFDRKDRIQSTTYQTAGNSDIDAKTIYRRNKKGLLTRIEHYKEGKLYLYSVFNYNYK